MLKINQDVFKDLKKWLKMLIYCLRWVVKERIVH